MYHRRKKARTSPNRRWRFYATAAGNSPVRSFLDKLSDEDAAEISAAMKEVEKGEDPGQHLGGDIREVKAAGDRQTFRILFAHEGEHDQVLLALHGFSKKEQKTRKEHIRLANERLRDWRSRHRR